MDLRRDVSNLLDSVRGAFKMWPVTTKTVFGARETRYQSNDADCVVATEVIQGAMVELDDACLAALSRAEVTALLRNVCNRVAAALKTLDVKSPTIDDDGEVKRPRNTRESA